MKTYYLGIIVITISLLSTKLYSQKTVNEFGDLLELKNSISFVPQYIYRGGLRLDYERRLKNNKNWILIAPQFFTDFEDPDYFNTSKYSDYTSMIGFGLNVYLKKMVYVIDDNNSNNVPKKWLYLAVGPGYQYYQLKNTEEVAIPYIEDGITYYRFGQQDVIKTIHRAGFHINGGLQFALDKLLIDIFMGVITRYSLDGNGEIIRDGDQYWTDIDYSGMSLDGGVRIGLYF